MPRCTFEKGHGIVKYSVCVGYFAYVEPTFPNKPKHSAESLDFQQISGKLFKLKVLPGSSWCLWCESFVNTTLRYWLYLI